MEIANMKFGTVVLTVFFMACAFAGVVWLGYFQPIQVDKNEFIKKTQSAPLPTIATEGPHPKAVVDSLKYKFGTAAVGKEYKHAFIVRNEGESPLVLRTDKTKSSCQCTVGSVGKSEIAPGESADVTLAWTPKKSDPRFHHYAIVDTNDPENRELKFEVEGAAFQSVMVDPTDVWQVNNLSKTEPSKVSGHLFSTVLDEFQIKNIKSTNPLLSAKAVKLSEKEIEYLRPESLMRQHMESDENESDPTNPAQFPDPPKIKSAYRIDMEVKPGSPVGPFSESVSVATDTDEGRVFVLDVRGERQGPWKLRALKNSRWSSDTMTINMGSFSSAEGRKSTLLLYLGNQDDPDLEFSDIKTDPEYLKIDLKTDPSFSGKGSKRYLFTVEVPAGSPRASRISNNPAKVSMKTNHPEVTEFKFNVQFITR